MAVRPLPVLFACQGCPQFGDLPPWLGAATAQRQFILAAPGERW